MGIFGPSTKSVKKLTKAINSLVKVLDKKEKPTLKFTIGPVEKRI